MYNLFNFESYVENIVRLIPGRRFQMAINYNGDLRIRYSDNLIPKLNDEFIDFSELHQNFIDNNRGFNVPDAISVLFY